jgi:uncharacterized protein with HEPN domain
MAVSKQTQSNLPEIPWKMVIGMRNQLVHGYFDISNKIIWSTVQEDVPILIVILQKTLNCI